MLEGSSKKAASDWTGQEIFYELWKNLVINLKFCLSGKPILISSGSILLLSVNIV